LGFGLWQRRLGWRWVYEKFCEAIMNFVWLGNGFFGFGQDFKDLGGKIYEITEFHIQNILKRFGEWMENYKFL
jgi:hypothetical protein